MEKRNPASDIPRRIYSTTISRIDEHLKNRPSKKKNGQNRKQVKGDFNQFLVFLLDYYEGLESAPRKYVTQSFDTLEEARGEAILQSVKTKKVVQWPEIVVVVGKDG